MNTGTVFYIILLCYRNKNICIFPFPVTSDERAATIERSCDYIYAIRCNSEEVDRITGWLGEIFDPKWGRGC